MLKQKQKELAVLIAVQVGKLQQKIDALRESGAPVDAPTNIKMHLEEVRRAAWEVHDKI